MYQNLVELIRNIVIKSQGDVDDVVGDDIRIQFVMDVALGVILKFCKGWRRKKCESMVQQLTAKKLIGHLNQCPIKHLDVESTRIGEFLVDLLVRKASQCDANVFRPRKTNSNRWTFSVVKLRKVLVV